MNGYYYRIYDVQTSETLDEGIVKDSEDSIFPEIWLRDFECPYISGEFTCHRFPSDERVAIEGYYFDISSQELEKFKNK